MAEGERFFGEVPRLSLDEGTLEWVEVGKGLRLGWVYFLEINGFDVWVGPLVMESIDMTTTVFRPPMSDKFLPMAFGIPIDQIMAAREWRVALEEEKYL